MWYITVSFQAVYKYLPLFSKFQRVTASFIAIFKQSDSLSSWDGYLDQYCDITTNNNRSYC